MVNTDHSPRGAKAPKAAETIAGVLRSEIVTGVVTDGERLGSGPELVERFGVSRPTLREAFRILEAENLIEIERGVYGGVIARRPDEGHTLRAMATVLQSRGATLSDVYEVRTVIEPAAVRRIAEGKARKTKVKALRAIADREDDAIDDLPTFAAATVEFHEQLVELSGNKTLYLLAEVLHDMIADAVGRLTELDSDSGGRARREAAVVAHRELIELIDKGKADDAETYWRAYMDVVGRMMLRNGGDSTVVSYAG
jgi:GntR family transcriptional regulator, transcriptional repressor for pyruvate dehydrogenase complex